MSALGTGGDGAQDTGGDLANLGDFISSRNGIGFEDFDAECEIHGKYAASKMTGFGPAHLCISACPKCRAEEDRRISEERDAAFSKEFRDREQARMVGLFATAGIPKRFQRCAFDNFAIDNDSGHEASQRRALKFCAAFADRWSNVCEHGNVLILTGPTGTGKTHLACAIANDVILRHGSNVVFGSVSDFTRGVKASFQKDSGRSEQASIQDLVKPDLLIMDEVGQRATEYDQQLVFDVINRRYADMKPIVLMSNLTEAELEAHLGDRIADRLREVGTFISMAWPSYRARRPEGGSKA